MTLLRLTAILFIFLCTCVAWGLLGSALTLRMNESSQQMSSEVSDVWGPALDQKHPSAFYLSSTSARSKIVVQPASSNIQVKLTYEAKKRGLFLHRTYGVDFQADYTVENPTPIPQTIYVVFPLPANNTSYQNFSFSLGDTAAQESTPKNGAVTEAVSVGPHQSVPLKVHYTTRGMNSWRYTFPNASRVRNFQLDLTTNFDEINFPSGTSSPTTRVERSHLFTWSYPDVISAAAIGMDMPKVLNAGPVATRISLFAPVSLLFFFAVILIVGMVQGSNLHPMNYFFLAAGCFSFQLLFAYLVDLVQLNVSFAIAAAISMVLVSGYIGLVAGHRLFWVALPAQFAYMVLFSYSFFFDGLTGLTITIGAIVTLTVLMILTARVDWAQIFVLRRKQLPPLPKQA